MPVHSHTVYTDDDYCAVKTGNTSYEWKQGLINAYATATSGKYKHYCGVVGGNVPHDNMEPYAVVYIFKRTV